MRRGNDTLRSPWKGESVITRVRWHQAKKQRTSRKYAVAGLAGQVRGALEVGDDVQCLELPHIVRRPILSQGTLEAVEGPAIGLERAGRLPLHAAGGEVERDQLGQRRICYGTSMNARGGQEVKDARRVARRPA